MKNEMLLDHVVDVDKMLPVDGIDPECVSICESLNAMPGIRTTSSCCGHGKHPFRVFFVAETLEALPLPAYWLGGCHCGFCGWNLIAYTDCGMCPIRFVVEGPVGAEAYQQAKEIAKLMAENDAYEE